MGGFFGAVSANDCIQDVFFGTDYHSHLGTRRGGMTSFSPELGFQRNIHSIENSPFRTKFEKDVDKKRGNINHDRNFYRTDRAQAHQHDIGDAVHKIGVADNFEILRAGGDYLRIR